MSRMRVLITGGSGFLGANLVREELRAGNEVHLLLRPKSNPWRLTDLKGQYRTQVGDIRDAEAVQRAVRQSRPDIVYHLAAQGMHPEQQNRNSILAVNVHGTLNLLEALAGWDYQALVHAGSSSEYGHKTEPMKPEDALEPRSDYGVTKASATLFCQAAALRGAPVCTVRVFSAYGPWEDPCRLASDVMRHCLRGENPRITWGLQPRDWIHADDVVRLMQTAAGTARARGRILHAGSGKPQTVRDMVEAIIRLVAPGRLKAEYGTLPPRPEEPTSWVANIDQTISLTGWSPQVDLKSGISSMWSWFVKQQKCAVA